MLPKNSSDTGVESPSIVNLVATGASLPVSSVQLLDTYKRKTPSNTIKGISKSLI